MCIDKTQRHLLDYVIWQFYSFSQHCDMSVQSKYVLQRSSLNCLYAASHLFSVTSKQPPLIKEKTEEYEENKGLLEKLGQSHISPAL